MTRRRRIDPKPRSAGWSVPAGTPTASADALAVHDFDTVLGPADYVSCERAQLVGVVEAKKLTGGAAGILPHAERYARAIAAELITPDIVDEELFGA